MAAYNAGEGRVAQAQAQAERDGKNPSIFENVRPYLPDSTQDYVDKVFASIGRFQSDFNG